MISKVFMLSKKNIIIPVNLINLAKKTPSVPVGIVCANHKSTMNSLKKAYEIGLINPIFIGQKKSINKEARNLNWNIDRFKIIDKNSDEEAANEGALLAAKNKIKVLIKGISQGSKVTISGGGQVAPTASVGNRLALK